MALARSPRNCFVKLELLLRATDQHNYRMLAMRTAALEDLVAVDTTPGRYVLQRPRVCADRLYDGSGRQMRDPVLEPDHWKRTE